MKQEVTSREIRLTELAARSADELEAFLNGLSQDAVLPKLDYHFLKHGARMGCSTMQEYEAAFLAHTQGLTLRYFTTIRGKDQARMWYTVDIRTGRIAQYNETRQRYWTFYQVDDIQRHLTERGVWWIEVRKR